MDCRPNPVSAKVVSGTNNIPTAYDTSAGSNAISGLGHKGYRHLFVYNGASTAIRVAFADPADGAPASDTTGFFYIPASSYVSFDEAKIFGSLYLESDGSAISSGTVYITVW